MDARPWLARAGEDMAARHLTRLGFAVVERNYRCPEGEIDIVARRGDLLVFCEVKTRRRDLWGEPSEAVGWEKQRRIRRLAARWMSESGSAHAEVRFDVISIVARNGAAALTHIPDAF